jgi:hypothetical protein
MPTYDTILKFRCHQDLIDRLSRIAAARRRSLPDMCRIIMEDYLSLEEQTALNEPSPAWRANPVTAVGEHLLGTGTAAAAKPAPRSKPKPKPE